MGLIGLIGLISPISFARDQSKGASMRMALSHNRLKKGRLFTSSASSHRMLCATSCMKTSFMRSAMSWP